MESQQTSEQIFPPSISNPQLIFDNIQTKTTPSISFVIGIVGDWKNCGLPSNQHHSYPFLSIQIYDKLTEYTAGQDNHVFVRMSDSDKSMQDANDEIGEISTAPSLYLRPMFFHQTRKNGKIIKSVSERYLRDDLGLGSYYIDKETSNRGVKEAGVQLICHIWPDIPWHICILTNMVTDIMYVGSW
jgi:hypothetical protein